MTALELIEDEDYRETDPDQMSYGEKSAYLRGIVDAKKKKPNS